MSFILIEERCIWNSCPRVGNSEQVCMWSVKAVATVCGQYVVGMLSVKAVGMQVGTVRMWSLCGWCVVTMWSLCGQ